MTTVKVRKKERTFGDLSEGEKYLIFKEFGDNPEVPLTVLCEKYNVNLDSFRVSLNRFYYSLVQAKETKLLITEQQLDQNQLKRKEDIVYYKKFKNPATMNQLFLEKLGEGDELSEAEHIYAYTYIFTGNNERALKQAGLAEGLSRDKKTNTPSILKMRGYYLRSIPRVKSLIQELRDSKLNDIPIDKGLIQSELIDLLFQLKEEGNPATLSHRLRIIEDLAKTCGAMTENIKVEKVDPSSALDILIMKAKEAEVNECNNQPDLIEIID